MSSQASSQAEDISESTPLLRTLSPIPEPECQSPEISDGSSPQDVDDVDDPEAPLPKVQMFFLCVARLVEPLSYFGIFPFINQMIFETGNIDEEDVGFYSGLIESMFSLTQMCLMILWGRLADRIGRKPVLVFSLAGVSVATAIFGLSTTIWQMVLYRCCAGIFAGSIVTIRTMITENSTQKTQARAFSFFAFSGNLGIFIGPLIGGALSNPTKQYPVNKLFAGLKFFEDFPYALPTFASGAIGVIATVCSFIFIKETLKRTGKGGAAVAPPMSTWEVTKAPGVPIALFVYGHTILLGLANTAVAPVFFFQSVKLGGFGLTPPQISLIIALIGIAQAFWLLVVFPPLQARYGTVSVLRGCLVVWPLLFTLNPLCNVMLKLGWTTAFWIVMPVGQALGTGVAMAFTCVQLLLNSATPSPPGITRYSTVNLGTLNAIALTLVSGTRTISPALFTTVFATGVRSQWLHGYFIWVVLVILAVIGWIVVRFFVDDIEGEGSKADIIVEHFSSEGETNGANGTNGTEEINGKVNGSTQS